MVFYVSTREGALGGRPGGGVTSVHLRPVDFDGGDCGLSVQGVGSLVLRRRKETVTHKRVSEHFMTKAGQRRSRVVAIERKAHPLVHHEQSFGELMHAIKQHEDGLREATVNVEQLLQESAGTGKLPFAKFFCVQECVVRVVRDAASAGV